MRNVHFCLLLHCNVNNPSQLHCLTVADSFRTANKHLRHRCSVIMFDQYKLANKQKTFSNGKILSVRYYILVCLMYTFRLVLSKQLWKPTNTQFTFAFDIQLSHQQAEKRRYFPFFWFINDENISTNRLIAAVLRGRRLTQLFIWPEYYRLVQWKCGSVYGSGTNGDI